MKKIAMVLGWVFLVLGVLGFITNPLIGGEEAVFHADLNLSLVHLITGLVLLWMVYKASHKIGTTLKVLGVIYVLLAILGFLLVSGTGSVLGLVEVNGADNWLHLVLGVVLFWGSRKGSLSAMPMQQAM